MTKQVRFPINGTAKDEEEREMIRSVFKKHKVSLAGFVMEKLREKAKRLEGEG